MKKASLYLSLITAITAMSFIPFTTDFSLKKGAYGDCDDQVKIQLTINEDHTFSYTNSIDPEKRINTSGKWQRDGNKIILTNYSSEYPIDDSWKIDRDYPCLKSRVGMNYVRICSCSK
jgi:hypothetical protein